MVMGAIVVITVGILTVNYFKDKNAQVLNDGINADSVKQHVVVSGESLWSISEDYYGSGYNWKELADANDLTDYTLEVGQTLTLPEVSAQEPTVTNSSVAGAQSDSISGDTYTVVHGDDLWDIAVSAYGDGYKWVEIAKANNLKNPDVIHSGNVLTLPR